MVRTPRSHCRGAQVRSLVRDLRSFMVHSFAKKLETNCQKTNLQRSGRLCGETRGVDQSKTSSGCRRIGNVFVLCEVMGTWIFTLLLCFKTSMYIFFDPVISLLRNILTEMKEQYIRICIKKKERKIKQKK